MNFNILAVLIALPFSNCLQWDDGTGRLPALGWNSWNAYGCEINETSILTAAQAMASLGFKVTSDDALDVNHTTNSSVL